MTSYLPEYQPWNDPQPELNYEFYLGWFKNTPTEGGDLEGVVVSPFIKRDLEADSGTPGNPEADG